MYEKHFGFVESPFNVSPDPHFFYTNPVYREALVTLHYGIEARKGFVIITGEAGTGKTTLLRMLLHNLDSAIHTAFIFNPRLSYIGLLRFILNDLGVAGSAKDRLKLTEQLNGYLIEQHKKGHTVALLVDEAQALSDEILEELRLLSNLETDRAKLIQIVLMGQPELERKLDQPELRQLKQRVTLRCRLLPLSQLEVGLYIASRLKTAGYQGKDLFVPKAVEKITRYSTGIPRMINVLCDNALVVAYAASKKHVSAEMIDAVARDLKFTGQPQTKAEHGATDFDSPDGFERVFPTRQARTHAMEEPWRSDFEPVRVVHTQNRSRGLAGLGMRALLGLATLAGAGIILYSQQTGSLAALDVDFKNLAGIKDLVGLQRENPEPARPEPSTEILKETPPYHLPDPQVPESRATEPRATEPNQNYALPEIKQHHEAVVAEVTAPSQIMKSKNSPVPSISNERPLRVPDDAAPTPEQLEFEVYKAIHNRAIRGVEVSVRDGTAYLAGRVATDRQKFAAAEAARRVPGVKEVRDRLIVNSDVAPADSGKGGETSH